MILNRRTLLVILALAAIVQTVIILYNNATGYITLYNIWAFFFRLIFGTLFSFPIAVAIITIDILMVQRIEKFYSWDTQFALRMTIETLFSVTTGAVWGSTITLVVNQIAPYKDGLLKNIINNSMITAVLGLIILAIVEAVISYRRNREARIKAEALERENSRIRFETLKTQLNPHFLFNSLNVLSSLLRTDTERAERFIDAFASTYRYTLDVIEQPIVELSRELEFSRSYLYLLEIRFENSIKVDIRIRSEHLDRFVPPLSLQTVLENVFKHNKVSEESPLYIRIESKDETVTVTNNLQPKLKPEESKGVGLKNLYKRYAFLGGMEPKFTLINNEFVAALPLINPE